MRTERPLGLWLLDPVVAMPFWFRNEPTRCLKSCEFDAMQISGLMNHPFLFCVSVTLPSPSNSPARYDQFISETTSAPSNRP